MQALDTEKSTIRLVGLFAGGLLFAVLSLVGQPDNSYLGWYLPTWSAAFALFLLGYSSRLPFTPTRWLVLIYVGYLAFATLSDGVISVSPLEIQYRAGLWFGNPNILAAALVVGGTSVLILFRSSWFRSLLLMLILGAVLITGSRTGLAAIIVAFALSAITQALNFRQVRRGAATILALGIGVITWQLFTFGTLDNYVPSTNLLYPTDTFEHKNWRIRGNEVSIEPVAEAGPYAGGQVFRLQAHTRPDADSSILIFQTRGVAPSGFQFVSSVYLKSDVPQQVGLGANYTRTVCNSTTVWTRCVAPVATGNGEGAIQLQIRAVELGDEIDVYLWGPQITEGVAPGRIHHRSVSTIENLRDSGALSRMDLRQAFGKRNSRRAELGSTAWQAFVSNPLFGVGFGSIAEWDLQRVGTDQVEPRARFTHAHNLVLQHLGEIGLLGFLSFLIPFVGVAVITLRQSRWRALPLVAAVMILNFSDFTFYNAGGFYVYWLSIGIACRMPVGRSGHK